MLNLSDIDDISDTYLPSSIVYHIQKENSATLTLEDLDCPGSEYDSVLYIGAGNAEVYSRARLTLGIITVNYDDKDHEKYKRIHNEAVTQGLLRTRPNGHTMR